MGCAVSEYEGVVLADAADLHLAGKAHALFALPLKAKLTSKFTFPKHTVPQRAALEVRAL